VVSSACIKLYRILDSCTIVYVPGMLVGQKGVKYGLQTRHPQTAAGKQGAAPLAAFAADSEDEEDVGQQVQKQAARKVTDAKV
jgi:hypothetical protein